MQQFFGQPSMRIRNIKKGTTMGSETAKKTLAEHLVSAEKIARLALWYGFELHRTLPGETLESVIRTRTPLFPTVFGQSVENIPDWFVPLPEAASAAEFEEKGWAQIKVPSLEAAAQYYPVSLGVYVDPKWNFGSLRYDPPTEKAPDTCSVHITNALAPKSIFDDPSYLPDCFFRLLADMRSHFGCCRIRIGSWLNSEPRFLALFPGEWQENLTSSDPVPVWHFGYWGQLFNARGLLNDRMDAFIRANLRLKYPMRVSHCSMENLEKHLKEAASKWNLSS